MRTYRIACPTAPLEPAGSRTLPGGVVRTVVYGPSGSKMVTWDFSNATF